MSRSHELIQPTFSDEESDNEDRFNAISELIIKGKKALKAGGGLLLFKKKLVKEMNVLSEKNEPTPELDLDNEYQSMILDSWIEELLRFLALKTITGDFTEPCQLLPGHAVGVAWKVLMTNPSLYSKVCHGMGNQHVFDHHPADTSASRVKAKHKIKRYNATLRAYESYFEQQPQPLYWSFHPKEKENFVAGFLSRLCGCDASFIADPFATKVRTRDTGMSPPLLV